MADIPQKRVASDIGKLSKSAETPKAQIDQFRRQVHLMEAELGRLESSGSLPESALRQVKLLHGHITKLTDEAAKYPEIAQALGLVGRPPVAPVEVPQLVSETKFETFDVRVEENVRATSAPLRSDWPRSGLASIGENRLADLETLGKVRVLMNDADGQPVAGAPFKVVAQQAKSDRALVLSNGHTDSYGYASVNLNGVRVADITGLSVEVGHADGPAPGGGASGQRFNILESHLTTHRDAGLVHMLRVDVPIQDRVPTGQTSPRDRADIEPDPADIRNSPQSFGLNTEEENGTCCLRPQRELPARQYFFRQIVRTQPPLLVAGPIRGILPTGESVELSQEGRLRVGVFSRPVADRPEIRAPIPYGQETESDYAVRGGGPILGFVNLYSQSWNPVGRGLGELLYSLALAPCEHVNLAFIDWTRSEVDTRREFAGASERFAHELHHDRSIGEVVDAVLEEEQSGRSTSGGGGASLDLGIFSIGGGGGHTTSSASGRREIQANTVQNISDQVVQRASSLRTQRSTVVTTSVQRESERISTRTVHNHNRNHAMTVQYFQVLSHYIATTELVEEKPVLLIPYEIEDDIFDDIPSFDKFVIAPSRPITRFLDRHREVLTRLVPTRFHPAFAALSRLLHCGDIYEIETPFATVSRWRIVLDQAWRTGIQFSIETSDEQSVPLRKLGEASDSTAVDFSSDPVKVSAIAALRINIDPVKTAGELAKLSLPDVFGDVIEDLLRKATEHVVKRCEIHIRTDRSRFVREPQSFRMVVEPASDLTLSPSNPAATLSLTPPTVSFEGYRGREHEDYCLVKELIAHIHANPMRFTRAIWFHEDPDRRLIRLDRFGFQGRPLPDQIVNRPVGVLGNYVAFPLLEGHRLVSTTDPNHVVDERLISLPTQGVFAEVFLSCCNATEIRDVERTIDPDNACQIQAPDITGVQPGSRRERRDLEPTPFPSPIVNLQNAPTVPEPTGLSGALSVLQTPDIFRDLTRGAELLQFINNATKEAFTSTRAHRAAMDKMAGQLLGAMLGAPVPPSGAQPTATTDSTPVTPTPSGGGTGGQLSTPRVTGGSNPLLQTMSSEMLRRTPPQRVSDHLQTVQRAVESGLLTPEQGNGIANSLLSGGVDATIAPASFVNPIPVICEFLRQRNSYWEAVKLEMVRVATEEFQTTWNNGTATEAQNTMQAVIENYWRDGVYSGGAVPVHITIPQTAWSAAFIAWVIFRAGERDTFSKVDDEADYRRGFRPAAHWRYAAAAKVNRQMMSTVNPFWTFAINEVEPRVGDIVIKSRNGSGATYATFDAVAPNGNYVAPETHGDIVVAVSAADITVIGGNSGPGSDTVYRRTFPRDANGFVQSTGGANDDHFAIVRINTDMFDALFCSTDDTTDTVLA